MHALLLQHDAGAVALATAVATAVDVASDLAIGAH
jgi:hypothetical protein